MSSQTASTASGPRSTSPLTNASDITITNSLTDSPPTTPNNRQRRLPLASPVQAVDSPFSARTPRTPGLKSPDAIATSCTSDEALFTIVKVHTAKCTECDKRNMDTMRRCPGCTFQICQPCYEKRKKDGRGLMHGNSLSSVMTPSTGHRITRRRVSSIASVSRTEKKEENRSEEDETEDVDQKGQQKPTSRPKCSGRKRAAQKKIQKPASEGSSSSFPSIDSTLLSGPSTANKRRRVTVNSHGSPRKRTRTSPTALGSGTTDHPQPSQGLRPEGRSINELMQMFGVNTLENPYQEHLLGRREHVRSNPRIMVPDNVKRNFKPRPTVEEIQKNIQEKTLQKIQEKALQNLDAQQVCHEDQHDGELEQQKQEITEKQVHALTVRTFAENGAAKHSDAVLFDDDENEALRNAIKETARQWCNNIFGNLKPDEQKVVRRGLDMRLDLIESRHTVELAKLMDACASQKLKELRVTKG